MKNRVLFINNWKAILAFSLFVFHFSFSFGQLNGTYTIDTSKAASKTNYKSFTSAAADLDSGIRHDGGKPNGKGVSGAVVFNVKGTFDECLHLTAIKGASDTSTVTFYGGTLYNDSFLGNNDAIYLDGAQWIVINNMTLYILDGYQTGSTIELGLNASNNTVSNCTLSDGSNFGYQSQYVINIHDFNSANTFSNNNISYDNYSSYEQGCVSITGSTNNYSIGNSFIYNTITSVGQMYDYGIHIIHQKIFNFTGNSVNDEHGIAGTLFQDDSFINISYNFFNGYYCGNSSMLSIINCPGIDTNHFSMIFNNFMTYLDYPPPEVLSPGPFTKFCFNNIYNILSYYPGAQWVGIAYTPDHDNYFMNNSIFLDGGDIIIDLDTSYISKKHFYMDYNCYYGPQDSFAIGLSTLKFSKWRLISGLDQHSILVNPDYISRSDDLHSTNFLLSGKGVAIQGITDDIDGVTRSNPPTIGANELPKDTEDAGVYSIDSPATKICRGKYNVVTRIENYGIDTLTSCTIGWSVNSSSTNYYSWTGSLRQGSVSAEIKLGFYVFTLGKDTLKIFTSMPNANPDEWNNNDTAVQSIIFNPPPILKNNVIDSIYCLNNSAQLLSVTPSGGYWSGKGMNQDYFHPAIAGIGSFSETYKYTDSITGCSNSLFVKLQVIDTPIVSFSAPDSSCLDSSVYFNAKISNASTKLWFFGDGGIDTALNPTHKYTKTGTYTVKLTVFSSAQCSDTVFKTIHIDNNCTTTGIHPYPSAYDIILYPNPAAETLNIESNSNPVQSITIFDVTGRVNFSIPHVRDGKVGIISIPVNNFPPGIYFIKLGLGNGSYEGKFMKE